MFLYKTRLERAQYWYKMESTNEVSKFSKFIPFFAKIGNFRGYEKWSLTVRTYEKTSSTTGCGCTFSIEAIELGREETEGAGE